MDDTPSPGGAAWGVALAEAQTRLAASGARFAQVFAHGSMRLELYAPRGHDPQTPHAQDELYVVISGSGTYLCAEARRAFGPGDALFAPAGAVHRFEDFTDDLAVWVVFYGPDGGEAQG